MDVSFDPWPGEVMGIVGESGSGKSTLLSCMAGHLEPDAGAVLFDMGGTFHDTLALSEPDRQRLRRTDWAYVRRNARDGLRMGVSAGGNVGERPMMMKGGLVVEAGLTGRVLDDPQHGYTQLLASYVLQV